MPILSSIAYWAIFISLPIGYKDHSLYWVYNRTSVSNAEVTNGGALPILTTGHKDARHLKRCAASTEMCDVCRDARHLLRCVASTAMRVVYRCPALSVPFVPRSSRLAQIHRPGSSKNSGSDTPVCLVRICANDKWSPQEPASHNLKELIIRYIAMWNKGFGGDTSANQVAL